jgi:TIR domain
MRRAGKWDFFVSYTKDDRLWAEWIAWTLEAAGYGVLIQAWDMVPGTNWVFAVDEGIRRAARTIAVASEAYLESDWARLEALGALHRDPLSRQRPLLVVRIEECRPEGPLGMITRIDVFGLPEADARTALLDGVGQAIRGRGKPTAQGTFPRQGRKACFPDGSAPNAGEQRICLALDVEDYRQLTQESRAQVRSRVLAMLFDALARADVRNEACVVIDRVDGLALIFPANFRGPAATAALVSELCTGVADIGRAAKGQPLIRCRVGVAAGTVDVTSWTFEGTAPASAQALVSCGQVRVAVALSRRTPNAVAVTDDLYREATAAALPAGFTKISISAADYSWITLISGTVPASGSARPPLGATTLGGTAAAGVVTGMLAAEEWQHLLHHEDGSTHEDATAFGDHGAGNPVGEPQQDPNPPAADQPDTDQGRDWADQPNPWDEDDPSYPGHGAKDDDGVPYDGSDIQDRDDTSDISGGLWDG